MLHRILDVDPGLPKHSHSTVLMAPDSRIGNTEIVGFPPQSRNECSSTPAYEGKREQIISFEAVIAQMGLSASGPDYRSFRTIPACRQRELIGPLTGSGVILFGLDVDIISTGLVEDPRRENSRFRCTAHNLKHLVTQRHDSIAGVLVTLTFIHNPFQNVIDMASFRRTDRMTDEAIVMVRHKTSGRPRSTWCLKLEPWNEPFSEMYEVCEGSLGV
jgi:hypothetical protein